MAKKYITKGEKEHGEFTTGMLREISVGKPRFDLLLIEGLPYEEQPLTLLADLLARGAEKYETRNREKASTKEEYDRFRESFLRHAVQAACGENDEDHKSAAIFNLMGMTLVEYRMNENKETIKK